MLLILLPRVRLHIKLKMYEQDDRIKGHFQILDAYLQVRRVHPKPANLSAQTMALSKRVLARYNKMSRPQNFSILRRIKIHVYRQCRAGPHPQTPGVRHD